MATELEPEIKIRAERRSRELLKTVAMATRCCGTLRVGGLTKQSGCQADLVGTVLQGAEGPNRKHHVVRRCPHAAGANEASA